MEKKNFSKKLFLGLTGQTSKDWRAKLKELNDLKLDTAALFLECYKKPERKKIYEALRKSSIKNIPLVHLRDDMDKNEIKYLLKTYKNPYLTIHEKDFLNLPKWRKFYKHLYLEMNKDNKINRKVDVNKIGGFCVDLSHFKAAEEKWSKEFEYTMEKRRRKNIFKCNHLNGYSPAKNEDMHTVKTLKDFDYLKTLPSFIFGDVIALEVFNPIKEQLTFKKYLLKFLHLK